MNKKQPQNIIKPTSAHSYSIDEFVIFLHDAFGLREGRRYNLHDVNSITALKTKVTEMVDMLAEHISPDDKDVQWKLSAMFEYMNLALLQFHKAEIYNDLNRGQLYSLLVRDVLLPMINDTLYLIAKKQAPLINNPDELCKFRSDKMICHLLYMLEPSYLKDASTNVENWFSYHKQLLKHGFATDFKKVIKNYGAKTSHVKLSTIIDCCAALEADKIPGCNEKYKEFPTHLELKSFWQSARAAQYFSKHIDFSFPAHNALLKFREELFTPLKTVMETGKYEINIDSMTEVSEDLSRHLMDRDYILAEREFFEYYRKSAESVTKRPPPPLADNSKPMVKFLHGFETVVLLIASNELLKAYKLSLTTIKNYDHLASGRYLDILIRLAIALEAKLELKATKRFEYDNHARKALLRGSDSFTYSKFNSDPFQKVNNSILSSFAIIYALSSINTYVEVLKDCKELSAEERIAAMIPFPSAIESALKSIYEIGVDLSDISLAAIKNNLSKFMDKNCIPYIPGSTLYNCLSEINTLATFWPQEMLDLVEYTQRFCQEPIHIKRKVLLAIDYSTYILDARLNAKEVSRPKIVFNVLGYTIELEPQPIYFDRNYDKCFFDEALKRSVSEVQYRSFLNTDLLAALLHVASNNELSESLINTPRSQLVTATLNLQPIDERVIEG